VIRLASDIRSTEVVGALVDMLGAEFKDYDDFAKKVWDALLQKPSSIVTSHDRQLL